MGGIPYRRLQPVSRKAGFGEIPKPTVIVWIGEERLCGAPCVAPNLCCVQTPSFRLIRGFCIDWGEAMDQQQDRQYMQRALQLAARAVGRTSPNPVVGAVIVHHGQVVGQGYHHKAGTPHAEVHALQQAGHDARGATVYVTLEPCSHYGKTPPCASALVQAGVERVVVAVVDPNPRVAGQGIAILRQAGIQVEVGLMEAEARQMNEAFFHVMQTGLSWVALKTAMTLDGKIATVTGDSRWITSPPARHYVHRLRDRYDGVVVGIGTVLADNPLLNTRLPEGKGRDPVRIIVDGSLALPVTSQIVQTSHQQRTLVFASLAADAEREEALIRKGVEVVRLDGDARRLNLKQMMEYLVRQGLNSLLVEGGAGLNASLVEQRLVHKVYWFVAPKMIGGDKAPGPVGGTGIAQMAEALMLKDSRIEQVGPDFLITAYTGW